jgi:HEAT repeat protein
MNRIQRLVGAQPKHANRFGGLFAGAIALSALTTGAVGAQILLQSSSRVDREIVSVREREAMKVGAAAETPNESKGDDAGQQTGSAQDDLAAEALLPILQSASWDVRKTAVERLAQVRGGRATQLLITALNDEHVQVREQAVIGLGIRQDERLAEHLIAALTDRDWEVREQAAIALGRINDERAVEPLLRALLDNEWAVREQAARSLGTAGQARAVEPLINALQDQHEQVREAAAKSLGIIGDRRALEPLSQALQDADEQVRKKAVEALGLLKQSGNESSMGALRKPMGKEAGIAPDQRVNQQRAGDDLGRLYDEQTEDRLKERVIIALGRLDNEQARAKLNEITRTEKRFFLRERAMDELARRLSAGAPT